MSVANAELTYRNVLRVHQLFRVSSVWALGLDANLATRTKRTMCGFVGLTVFFRGLVKFWWYLDLDLLKRVLILTVDILVSCLLSFMFVVCLAHGFLPLFFPYDGKGNSTMTLRLFNSIDIYVQHIGFPVVHNVESWGCPHDLLHVFNASLVVDDFHLE